MAKKRRAKRKSKLSQVIFFVVAILVIAYFVDNSSNLNNDFFQFFKDENSTTQFENAELKVYYPESAKPLEIIEHLAFSLGYYEPYEVAFWEVHKLNKDLIAMEKIASREARFYSDPSVSTESAISDDYKNSGYDRGHLAPAADFAYNQDYMTESFYMSNITPQNPQLNQGLWAAIESWVRLKAQFSKSLVIFTGPIYDHTTQPQYIGQANRVAVPEAFYKIIFNEENGQIMAFITENYGYSKESRKNLQSFAVSIEAIEERSELTFFDGIFEDASVKEKILIQDWF